VMEQNQMSKSLSIVYQQIQKNFMSYLLQNMFYIPMSHLINNSITNPLLILYLLFILLFLFICTTLVIILIILHTIILVQTFLFHPISSIQTAAIRRLIIHFLLIFPLTVLMVLIIIIPMIVHLLQHIDSSKFINVFY